MDQAIIVKHADEQINAARAIIAEQQALINQWTTVRNALRVKTAKPPVAIATVADENPRSAAQKARWEKTRQQAAVS